MENEEGKLLKEIRDLLINQNSLISSIKEQNDEVKLNAAKAQVENQRFLEKNLKLKAAEVRNNLIFLTFIIVIISTLFLAPRLV